MHLHLDARCLAGIGIQIQEPFAASKCKILHYVSSGLAVDINGSASQTARGMTMKLVPECVCGASPCIALS